MNAIVPAYQNVGLVPSSMTEAMKLAEMMASAKLVPAALQKSPADCLMVIQQAVRWQMDPFAVAQECSVIQGKLMHSGKLVAAVVNARGYLTERLSFDYAGKGDDRTITVSGRLHGETTPRTVTVRMGDAKTSNKVWQTQPDQQLMYHGCRVWARRHTPELMLGVYSPEEFDEPQNGNGAMRDVSPTAVKAPSIAPPEQSPDDLMTFMLKAIDGMADIVKLNEWATRHKPAFARLSSDQQAMVREAAELKRGFLAQAPATNDVIDAETGEIIDGPETDPLIVNYAGWLKDIEARLTAASSDERADIWEREIEPRIEAKAIMPPDQDTLRALVRGA